MPERVAPAASPLSAADLARADRTARRLHARISALLDALPVGARNASGLARHLGIDRTTCQRAVFAVSRPYAGPELFSMLPGVRGLEQLLAAAAAARPPVDAAVRDGLTAAIEQYRELLSAMGGSQSRLLRRLQRSAAASESAANTLRTSADASGRDARVRLFDAAAELTGRHSECWVAAYVYGPVPGEPGRLDVGRAHGLIGHVARKDAVPLVVHNFSTRPEHDASDGPGRFTSLERDAAHARGRALDPVLLEFTTDPPPLVTSQQPDAFLVQSIDEREPAFGHPVDLLLGTRTSIPHPTTQAHPVEEAWALINFPCRHLLFDVWMHRDLARTCIPALDTHLWRPDFAQQTGDRWQTRFAASPTLQLLGPGPHRAAPAAWPRMLDLTRHLFERLERDPGEYIGFRCEVDHPIWRAGYCVSFDFTRPQDGSGDAGETPAARPR